MFEELSRIYIRSVSNSKAESAHLAQGGGCEFVVAKGRPQVWVWYEGGRGWLFGVRSYFSSQLLGRHSVSFSFLVA